jgi:hypothetical protein
MYTDEEAGRLTGDKQVAWLQGIVDKHKLAVDSQFARRLVHADLRRLLAALAMAYFRYRLAADGSIDGYLQSSLKNCSADIFATHVLEKLPDEALAGLSTMLTLDHYAIALRHLTVAGCSSFLQRLSPLSFLAVADRLARSPAAAKVIGLADRHPLTLDSPAAVSQPTTGTYRQRLLPKERDQPCGF